MQHLMASTHGLAVSMPAPNSKSYRREDEGVREAIAALISAAPDLYEALAMAVAPFEHVSDEQLDCAHSHMAIPALGRYSPKQAQQMRAALKKARGEPNG